MAFTAQEKSQVQKFVLGTLHLMQGMRELANVCGDHGHDKRVELHKALGSVRSTWEQSRGWISSLVGVYKQGSASDRALQIADAVVGYNATMTAANSMVTYAATIPEFSQAHASLVAARDTFSGFDWTLAYMNPRHENNPNTPFDEAKTIVGPHGNWLQAVDSMNFNMWYTALTMADFLKIYQGVPVFPQEANAPLKGQILDFADMMERNARVYSMHLEVEAPQDAAIIDMDHATSSGARSRAFFRGMLQNELLFNTRLSVGQAWNGRPFERGMVETLGMVNTGQLMNILGAANGEQWVWDTVIADAGQFGGVYANFTNKLTDFWQVMDAWCQSSFGFYFAMTDPTIFVPVEPPPPPDNTTIPLGYFNPQAAQIAQSKAEISAVDAEMDALLASLRALEGHPLGESQNV